MNLGRVIIVCVRSKNFSRGRIVEANCILESTPSPHFGLDVVYKMGGRINGTLGTCMSYGEKSGVAIDVNTSCHNNRCFF